MYASYFGLAECPFSLAPDPRYLYLSDGHREALAHLLYGLSDGGGFVQLTGAVGSGKTTVCRALLEQLPDGVDVAMIFNPRLTSVELIATVCDELHVAYPTDPTSPKALVDALSRALLDAHARGRRTVLIIDEAQNLDHEVLEELRLLTNLETTRDKLLHVILIGQPELATQLRRPQLRQLAQRVTARYHLGPFSCRETRAYVEHRLRVARQRAPIFTPGALRAVHRRAGGVPRLINSICDRALLGAFARNRPRVTAGIVRRAAVEVLGRTPPLRRLAPGVAASVAIGVLAVVVAVGPARVSRLANAWRPTAHLVASALVKPITVTPVARAPSLPPDAPVSALRAATTSPPTPAPPAAAPPAAAPPATAPLATAPAVPSPARPSLAAILVDAGGAHDKHGAFATLYGVWGVGYQARPGMLACAYGRDVGFDCLFRVGTWNLLRRIGLPAILTLNTAAGWPRYAVITRLDDTAATLTIDDRTMTLPLDEIEPFWDGEFVALWKRPPLGPSPIKPGMAGRDVVWIRQRLGEVDGGPTAPEQSSVYDDELKRRVVGFQHAYGLTPDGIIGEETLLRLVTATSPLPVPSLTAREARPSLDTGAQTGFGR